MSVTKEYILHEEVIHKKLERLALEIIENNLEEEELILVGIAQKGIVLAENISRLIKHYSSIKTKLLTLKLNKQKPDIIELSEQIDFNNKTVILIDDVTNSGKTLLYAMKPFLNYQPRKIEILVLVERSHTSFPIKPDYKGLSLATTLQEHISVEVQGAKIAGVYFD